MQSMQRLKTACKLLATTIPFEQARRAASAGTIAQYIFLNNPASLATPLRFEGIRSVSGFFTSYRPIALERQPPLLDSDGARSLWNSSIASQQAAATATNNTGNSEAVPPQRPIMNIRDRVDSMPTAVVKEISMKAQVNFEASWKKMEQRLGDTYVCPREIVWLNGAPGSGKGTNIPFILKTRGMSRAVGMSQLLDSSPEIREMIDRAELVPDALVLDALLDAVLNPDLNDGAGLVIDGFPRTATQVDYVKLLYDKLIQLYHHNADGPDEWRFPRPSFKVVILYVDEEESVHRQSQRAKLASLHNQRALDAGTGDVWNVRTTDISEALCRRRYQVFKAHYSTILRLKTYFPFSLIDAMGSLDECRAQIVRELRYQSSLDLDEKTYAAIKHLPLARDLVRVARQRLVFRLDSYCKRHNKMFSEVISLIDSEVLPLLKKCSLAGHADYKTRHPLLLGNTLAIEMLIDVLSDRGFSVGHAIEDRVVPRRIDIKSGQILSDLEEVHSFRITFDKENVRDIATPSSVTTKHGEDVAIGATWVPRHMQRGEEMEVPVRTPGENGSERNSVKKHLFKKYASKAAKQSTSKKNNHDGQNAAEGSPSYGDDADARTSGPAHGSTDTTAYEKHNKRKEKDDAQRDRVAQNVALAAAASAAASCGEEVTFLTGWESMDADFSSAAGRRYGYGYDIMNERED
jgi:adenylate kinase family enzyme